MLEEKMQGNTTSSTLWFRPFKIAVAEGKNYFLLENLDENILDAPINGCYLNNFMK
jgi:hypothetical protein